MELNKSFSHEIEKLIKEWDLSLSKNQIPPPYTTLFESTTFVGMVKSYRTLILKYEDSIEKLKELMEREKFFELIRDCEKDNGNSLVSYFSKSIQTTFSLEDKIKVTFFFFF